MGLTTEQITKLRVADIREELKKRGLDPNGTKAQLINRLISSAEKESESEKEEPLTPEEKEESVPAEVPKDSQETPKEGKEEGVTPGTDEDGEIKPKHTPIVYNIARKDAAALKADEDAKKKRRAERFGAVDATEHEAKKLKARSERFNVKFTEHETAKFEQRAKRFAPDSAKESDDQKESKGLIDLSHIVTSSSVTEAEKKKRRAERFGVASK